MNNGTRLFLIAKKIRSINISGPGLSAWKTIFNLGDNKNINYHIITNVSKIIQITFDVEEQLNSIDGINQSLYKRPLTEIRNAFLNHNFHANWTQFRDKFTPEMIRGLEFLADALSAVYKEEDIPEKDLSLIGEKIDQLFRETLDVSLEPVIRSFILKSLSNISNAIKNYQIFGAEGIKESLANALGNILIEKEAIQNSSAEDRDYLEKTMNILKKVASVLNIYRYGKQLSIEFANEIKMISNCF